MGRYLDHQDFFAWTIKAIRDDASKPFWLEDRKAEWVPLVRDTIYYILDGYSVVLMSDHERSWFVEYAMSVINRPYRGRPFFPIYSITAFYTHLIQFNPNSSEGVALLQDMLSISFGEKYLFWYIGKTDGVCAKLAFSHECSFNWLLGEQRQNSFFLDSTDELLDIKLMQLLRVFDKSLSAALFGEVLIGG